MILLAGHLEGRYKTAPVTRCKIVKGCQAWIIPHDVSMPRVPAYYVDCTQVTKAPTSYSGEAGTSSSVRGRLAASREHGTYGLVHDTPCNHCCRNIRGHSTQQTSLCLPCGLMAWLLALGLALLACVALAWLGLTWFVLGFLNDVKSKSLSSLYVPPLPPSPPAHTTTRLLVNYTNLASHPWTLSSMQCSEGHCNGGYRCVPCCPPEFYSTEIICHRHRYNIDARTTS